MKTHYVYPVVVERTETNLSMYFPDFPGTAVTAAELAEGLSRAKELLAFRAQELEEAGQPLPQPSEPDQIELEDASDRIVFVEIYMPPYRDAAANKAVTKNCTLPKWLRDAADEAGLNFSQVLQTGLKDALGLERRK
ncbi:type II toxin-antitoxin system HicB family antitoxin [Paenibacillus sp. HN-1]|uniref:type II toxin-antitoxin system HicB family antitoxin n=1 Tax=Paenibacillus TaxID=44249 RepID=UPI001CAA108B|nr:MULTISPECIES: type II toxin-antitoxin system HicB family antitoxin [Paenibacillus]MBY9080976.1 type II toxin-antitoxin system HicB family antitoxin [Paenibacillus sp. CGMCC 1.18879]MBY9083188.1 type II toxin-antitoxin system HicB family antitoxin [Paenibacillus sinensis]